MSEKENFDWYTREQNPQQASQENIDNTQEQEQVQDAQFSPIEDEQLQRDSFRSGQEQPFESKKPQQSPYATAQSDTRPNGGVFYTETVLQKNKRKRNWFAAGAGLLAGLLLSAMVFGGYTMFHSGIGRRIQENKPPENAIVNSENSFDFNQLNAGDRKQLSVVEIAQQVGPTVVGISTKSQVSSFFGPAEQSGSGSGIVISADGYIVTNQHVIAGATEVKVQMNTGQEYEAKIIGADEKTDLAIVKIETSDLEVANLGSSDELQVGELAIAIGNPLGTELAGSVTVGVISAVNRTIQLENGVMKLIQTDAAINPGNSGGALVNGYGEIVGINNMKFSGDNIEGIGFAIPIDEAKPIMNDLMNDGYVKGRPLMGITVQVVTEELAYRNDIPTGLYVASTAILGAADRAGIERGDILTSVNGEKLTTSKQLTELIDSSQVGDVLHFEIYRDGETLSVEVTLQEDKSSLPMPDDRQNR